MEEYRAMDTPWTITLFGGLAATQGERRITRFHTQKTGALLAFLAFYRDRSHSREVLIEMFWPGDNLQAGRHSLSMALSSLRHQMEPPGVPAGTVLVADRFTVGLNARTVTTDVARFEQALAGARRSATPSERAERLSAALDLYGGPLLPGAYEEWTLGEQSRLETLFLEAARELIDLRERAGDLPAAIAAARRATQADPLREEARHALIRLLDRDGRGGEALREFADYARRLNEETGDAPGGALQALARRISEKRGETVAHHPLRGYPVPNNGGTGDAGPADSLSGPPIIGGGGGKDDENLPTGTVTFLLADLPAEDAEHLRTEFRRHDGHEVRMGASDIAAIAFGGAGDALRCALGCRRAVPTPRFALHTGDVGGDGEDAYGGAVLAHARRLLGAAHGGQILASEAFAGVLRSSTTAGDVRLSDLGRFRLGGEASATERLFQADAGETTAFPPPLAEAAHVGSLPLTLTRFFGRETEIARLVQMIRIEGARLITLSGPGGTGKTRLALEVATRLAAPFAGAVTFVPLAEIEDARQIGEAVAAALRLPPRPPGLDALAQIARALADRPALLVLDNLEQLVERGGPDVVCALLEAAPRLHCLITSRQILLVPGEREFAVPPLPTPGAAHTPEHLARFESVQLFVDRAQAVRPDFQITGHNAPALADLCDRLEGIPLALELAASRAQVLTPGQMLGQLERRFDFLVSRRREAARAAARHATLRAAMDWSVRLLDPELARFWERLSVFRGGWSLEAAEAVTGDPLTLDRLAQLRECSLLQSEESAGTIRFRMLETLREFAGERLDGAGRDEARRRHRDFFQALALAADADLTQGGAAQTEWLRRLESEHDNLRAALDASLLGEGDSALHFVAALQRFWFVRGHYTEARERTARALRIGAPEPSAARARALTGAGMLADKQGDYAAARPDLEQAVALWRGLGDGRGLADALNNLANTVSNEGDYVHARALYEESLDLRRAAGDKRGIAASLNNLAALLGQNEGDQEGSRRLYEEALALNRETGNRAWEATVLNNLGWIAVAQDRAADAERLIEESLQIRRALGDRHGIAFCLGNLGGLAQRAGDRALARARYAEALDLCRALGERGGLVLALESLARLAAEAGETTQASRAARLFGAVEHLRETGNMPRVPAARPAHEATLTAARDVLGADAFDAAFSAGRALSLDAALDEALR